MKKEPPIRHTVTALLEQVAQGPRTHAQMLEDIALASTDSWSADHLVEAFQELTIVKDRINPIYTASKSAEPGWLSVGFIGASGEPRWLARFRINAHDRLTRHKSD